MIKPQHLKLILSAAATVAIGLFMLNLGLKNTLDARLYYGAAYFAEFFDRLEPELRHLYTVHESADLLFMVSYGLLLYFGLQSLFGPRSIWRWAAAVPVFLDAVETITILLCLSDHVEPVSVGHLGVVTFLKWASGFALVGAALLRLLLVRLRAARRQ